MRLTPEQRAIVAEPSRITLIEAVAGAGKTTTLAQLVAHEIQQGMDAARIVALVFSDTAADVFRRRLADAGGAAMRAIRVVTYGEYARATLRAWAARGMIDPPPAPAGEPALRRWVWQAIEQAAAAPRADPDYRFDLTNQHAENILDVLARLKGTLELRQLDEQSDDALADTWDLPRGLVAVCRQFERLRIPETGSFAFQGDDDWLFDALNLCRDADGALRFERPALVVADEWHDANAAHLELLAHLVGPSTRLAAMGDQEQVVHARHGADPRFMGEHFFARFPDARVMPLTESFRCGPTLGAASRHLNGKPFSSRLRRDTTFDTLAYDAGQPGDCMARVADLLASFQAKADGTFDLADTAVILRDAYQSVELETALIERDIPHVLEGCTPYLRRPEILVLRGLLHILAGNAFSVSRRAHALKEFSLLARALADYAGVTFNDAEWKKIDYELLNSTGDNLLRIFFENRLVVAHSADPFDMSWSTRLYHAIEQLSPQAATLSAHRLLTDAVERLRLDSFMRGLFIHQQQADTAVRSIGAFLDIAARDGRGAADFLDWIDGIQRRAVAVQRQRRRVTITPAHHAKGKEWDCVIMPLLQRGEFPRRDADPGEERRLFYVAMTRSRHQVYLCIPDGQAPSPFVDALDLPEARREGSAQLRKNLATYTPE